MKFRTLACSLFAFALATAGATRLSGPRLEKIPEEVGRAIVENLEQFTVMKEHPEGFARIEDVRFDWISIAGVHTRAAVFEDLFLFPYLNQAEERSGWKTGIALRTNSPITYQWRLDED